MPQRQRGQVLVYGCQFVDGNPRATAAAAREDLFGSLIWAIEKDIEFGDSKIVPSLGKFKFLKLCSLAHGRGIFGIEVFSDLRILDEIFQLIFADWDPNCFDRDDIATLCGHLQLPELLADSSRKLAGETRILRREQLAELDGDAGRCFYTAVLIKGIIFDANCQRMEAYYQWR
jgi:hypothetical protein